MESCGFLGREMIEQERYFMKSDYMNELADYFDILIRAPWQGFEHLSLDTAF